ncbi:MAG: hypothetical protein M1820_002406 [Bogoriella megaspora]|nr:MAG: hypothetical protein M1820_002406 [Bogoriella megaspora]
MGCCHSTEAIGDAANNPPNQPINNDPPAPQQDPNARQSVSAASSVAPPFGPDSSRTNIIQNDGTTSTSTPAPSTTRRQTSTSANPASSKADKQRRGMFSRNNSNRSSQAPSEPRSAMKRRPASERPNQQIRFPSPIPTSPHNPNIPDNLQPSRPWTSAVLRQQREEFFDTQTSGSQDAWAILSMACDALAEAFDNRHVTEAGRRIEVPAEGTDVSNAQTILDAAGLTCPTGRMRDGVYDELGNRYVIPAWVVRPPNDVIQDTQAQQEEVQREDKGETGNDDEKDEAEKERRKEEKGKGKMTEVVEEEETIEVVVRHADQEYKIQALTSTPVGSISFAFQIKAELDEGARVRLFYLGKELDYKRSLLAQSADRFKSGDVVLASVSYPRSNLV